MTRIRLKRGLRVHMEDVVTARRTHQEAAAVEVHMANGDVHVVKVKDLDADALYFLLGHDG